MCAEFKFVQIWAPRLPLFLCVGRVLSLLHLRAPSSPRRLCSSGVLAGQGGCRASQHLHAVSQTPQRLPWTLAHHLEVIILNLFGNAAWWPVF